MAFCIDFAVDGISTPYGRLEVMEYEEEELQSELREWKARAPEELSDYDRIVFSLEDEADQFLKSYKRFYKTLGKHCVSRDLPAMAYKRRMLVWALMGYKLETRRDYKKNWEPGQLFNLHDRTYFVTVKLESITKEGGEYCYRFSLIQN